MKMVGAKELDFGVLRIPMGDAMKTDTTTALEEALR